MARPLKPSEYLSRPIPKNPKYADVQPVINSGPNLKKVLDQPRAMFARFKKENEIFQRVKPTELAAAIEIVQNQEENQQQSQYYPDSLPANEGSSKESNHGQHGILNPEPARGGRTMLDVDDSSMYLLLDLRDPEEYEACHIESAISYPARMLSRAINCFTPEMYRYRNREGKIVICYDDDEKIATNACTIIFQRGFDNVAMLSGGLQFFAERFPHLIIGVAPQPLSVRQSKSKPNSRPTTPTLSTSVRSSVASDWSSVRSSASFSSNSSVSSSFSSLSSQKRPLSASRRPSSPIPTPRPSSPSQKRPGPEFGRPWK